MIRTKRRLPGFDVDLHLQRVAREPQGVRAELLAGLGRPAGVIGLAMAAVGLQEQHFLPPEPAIKCYYCSHFGCLRQWVQVGVALRRHCYRQRHHYFDLT